MNLGAKRFEVRAGTAGVPPDPGVGDRAWRASVNRGRARHPRSQAQTPKLFALAAELQPLLLPLISTAMLIGFSWSQDFAPAARFHPLLTFPILMLGAWPALLLLGHITDAIGSPTSPQVRQRILDDRFIGSFGVCAIALSALVQLTVSIGAQSLTVALAAAPLSSSLQGLMCSRATRARTHLEQGAALVLLILFTALPAIILAAPLAYGFSAATGLVMAWILRHDLRHGISVAAVTAGHVSLLTLLIFEGV
jgi:hypothetical protein